MIISKIKVVMLLMYLVNIYDSACCMGLEQYITESLEKDIKTIVIPEGIYSVNDTIIIGPKFNGIELVAENDNVEIISSQNAPVIHIEDVNDFKLKGFAFRSISSNSTNEEVGFYFEGGSWDNGSTAIFIADSSHIEVSYNKIYGYWIGINITYKGKTTSNIHINNNKVSNCGYWSIAARYLSGSDFIDNNEKYLHNIFFNENEIYRCEQGPVFQNVAYGQMYKNIVSDNIIGIRIEESIFCIVRSNIVNNNMKSGIWIYHKSFHNHIVYNKIYDNNMQAEKIEKIAKNRGCNEEPLPGNLTCFNKRPKAVNDEYWKLRGDPKNKLAYEPDFWPYFTAYDHITPSNRIPDHLSKDVNEKFWGIYFCQWSGVGIELRNQASHNVIEFNDIFNSENVRKIGRGMVYGIRISQLNLMSPAKYASRFNWIRHNNIKNMLNGLVLDDNVGYVSDAGNVYERNDPAVK